MCYGCLQRINAVLVIPIWMVLWMVMHVDLSKLTINWAWFYNSAKILNGKKIVCYHCESSETDCVSEFQYGLLNTSVNWKSNTVFRSRFYLKLIKSDCFAWLIFPSLFCTFNRIGATKEKWKRKFFSLFYFIFQIYSKWQSAAVLDESIDTFVQLNYTILLVMLT